MIIRRNHSYPQNKLTLNFDNASLEAEFRALHSHKMLPQIRIALIIAAILYALFSILDAIVLTDAPTSTIVIRFVFAVPIFLLGYFATYHKYFQVRLQTVVGVIVYLAGLGIGLIGLSYEQTQSDLFLTGTLLPVFWAFIYSGLRFINAVFVCLCLMVTFNVTYNFFSAMPYETLLSYNFYLLASFLIGSLGGYTIERYFRRDFLNQKIIQEEKDENDRLILNILPMNIADELKRKPGTIAKDYDHISVLFADIVGFSQVTKNYDAHKVVTLLNGLFSLFDALTDTYKLEKIKTIGDAYMVISHLQASPKIGVISVADFALAIQKCAAEYSLQANVDFCLRIGIHTGPAVAGVIGVKKFVYDVWGNTVNVASRMESTCPNINIQVSESSFKLLEPNFIFECRGDIDVKGIGKMKTYLLRSRKEEHSQRDDDSIENKIQAFTESPAI